MTKAPLLRGVHHCHIEVDDVDEAVTFYRQVMGFDVVPEYEFWYHEQENGPLMLRDAAKSICLALFKGSKRSSGIAFNVSADEFIKWQAHLAHHGVAATLFDHTVSYSLYFKDVSGNMHEITCYDYHALAAKLNQD